MPTIDIDRASKLDKIHTKRVLHAFAQVVLNLINLEDDRVNSILRQYSIAVMPGPVAGIDYAPGAKQILEHDLELEKAGEIMIAAAKAKRNKRKR